MKLQCLTWWLRQKKTLPDIEIILEEDGSATVEIGEEDSSSVDFYANLAEVVDPDVLGLISSELGQIFDADKSSRQDWEQMYAKGLDLLWPKNRGKNKTFPWCGRCYAPNADRIHCPVPGAGHEGADALGWPGKNAGFGQGND
jgi:hypothetical protein